VGHTHISPGVHLAGNLVVGECTHIGIGAVELPNLRIGNDCFIGAGSVVRENVSVNIAVAGNLAPRIDS